MLWIALAVQLTAAKPIDPVRWFYDADWEKLVASKGGHGLTLFRVTVTPDGRPQDCVIETTSGVPELDRLTCERVLQRARFRPAKWADGTPAYDVYRKSVLWADLAAFEYSFPVDVEIKVSRMPKGARAPMKLTVTFAVDASGRRSSCEALDRNANPTLVSLACQQVLANYPAIPAKNRAGATVPSIQNATVNFVTD